MRSHAGLRARISNLRRRITPRSTAGLTSASTLNNVVDGDFINKLDRVSLLIGDDLVSGLMGEHLSARRTTGIEFSDYRQYSAGDDLRRVDWNAYARLGSLHVRQSQAEHDTVLYMLVDASPSMDFGSPTKFLAACRLAAGLGYIALTHLDAVVLAAPGVRGQSSLAGDLDTRIEAQSQVYLSATSGAALLQGTFRGRPQSAALFKQLQAMEPGTTAEFSGVLNGWNSLRSGGVGRIAVIISDLLLDGWQVSLRELVISGFAVTLLHMLSPEEMLPQKMGDFSLVDAESGEQLEVHIGEASLREYRRRLDAWLIETEAWCALNGVRYLRLPSNLDVERTLLEQFKRRGVTA